jgi:hypothetical protein
VRTSFPPRSVADMTDSTIHLHTTGAAGPSSLHYRLNTRWHEAALRVFMIIVLFHWVEHLVQAYQAFVLHWPRPMAMGLMGMYFPWLMKTEVFHYGFAVVMLAGLWSLRSGFTGSARTWWSVALWIQFWHHIEHGLLFYQALSHHYLFGRAVPTSVAQIWFPKIELHLFYNTIVFIPMAIGMYRHLFPSSEEAHTALCTCARHRAEMVSAAA